MRVRKIRVHNEKLQGSARVHLTDELLHKIVTANSPEAFLDAELSEERSLAAFLCAKLEEKNLKKSTVIKAALLNETFGYQIFSGQRHPSRDKVLALSLAMGFDLGETRRALSYADVGDLYYKNRRDAIISFCISHGYDLAQTDHELFRFGEETINDAG